MINSKRKQNGYAANKGENSKRPSYANAHDTDTCDFLAVLLELGGRPRKELANFSKEFAKKNGLQINASEDEPHIHRS